MHRKGMRGVGARVGRGSGVGGETVVPSYGSEQNASSGTVRILRRIEDNGTS